MKKQNIQSFYLIYSTIQIIISFVKETSKINYLATYSIKISKNCKVDNFYSN